jgi:hypothetical protein
LYKKDDGMKILRRGLRLIAGILWLLMAQIVTADTTLPPFAVFEILEGQGVEVCEACLQAFEAIGLGADGVGLSGCERNYASEYGLSAPQWTDLSPLTHRSILKRVMLFLMPLDPESYVGTGRSTMFEGTIYETDDIFKREIKTEMKHERLEIARSMIDINNDGRPEQVLKYRTGICSNPQAPPATRALDVLGPDRRSIDGIKADLVLRNDRKRIEHPAGNPFDKIYDVFFFKEHVYFDKWDRSADPDIVTVYQAKIEKVTSLCTFRYKISYRLKSSGGKP